MRTEQTGQAGFVDTPRHSGLPCYTLNKHQACSPILDEVGPTVPRAAVVAPTE